MTDNHTRSAIGFKTAMLLFALLVVIAFATLKGVALAIGLIIIGALAIKSYVYHLRSRL